MLLALAMSWGASCAVVAPAPLVPAAPQVSARRDAADALLADFAAAARAGDPEALRALFDEDAFIERAGAHAGDAWTPAVERRARGSHAQAVAAGFLLDLELFLEDADDPVWNVRPDSDAPSVGVVRARWRGGDEIVDYYLRLWVKPVGGHLWLYDFELEDHVAPGSEQLAFVAVAPTLSSRAQELAREYSEAVFLAQSASDPESAGEAWDALRELDDATDDFVLQMADVRRYFLMETALLLGDEAAAVTAARELAASRPDCAIAQFRLGTFAADSGRYEAAASRFRRYQQLVGEDTAALERMGECYSNLGRVDRAWRCWTSALESWPSHFAALSAMGVHAEGARRAELADLVLASPFFEEHLEPLLQHWDDAGACATVEAVSAVVREARPREANAYYYASNCARERGDADEALALAAAGLACAPDDEVPFYQELWSGAAVATADPVATLRAAADPATAFDLMAERAVFGEADVELLDRLVTAREQDAPDDPWLPYYRGKRCAMRGEVDEADAIFLEVIRADGPMERSEFGEACWYARLELLHEHGRVADAYLGTPDEETYRYLLLLVCEDDGGDGLRALVAVRAARVPADPELAFWRAHATFLDGRYAEADAELAACRDRWEHLDAVNRLADEDLVRIAIRTGRLDEALERARASTRRDGDPLHELLARVARREADATVAVMEELLALEYDPGLGYDDPDTAEILRQDPAFAAFRDRWPPPE